MASYKKRGKTWQYEISFKKADGKYDKIRKSGFKTKKEAQSVAEELEQNMKRGYKAHDKDVTLYEYFENWFSLYKEGKIAKATELKYKDTLQSIEKFAPFQTVRELDRATYQSLINSYAKTHAKGTVIKFNNHIRSCLKDAVEDGYILFDPTRKVVLGGDKPSKPKNEKYLDLDSYKKIITIARSKLNPVSPSHYAIIMAGATGMRVGEILGITWDDLDFTEGSVNINKTWDYKFNSGFSKTKTESSIRKIYLDSSTLQIFKMYQQKQEELFQVNSVANENKHIFFHPINGVVTSSAINKALKKICNDNNISPSITVHGMRHTLASILLYKGISIYKVSRLLGHSSVATTQNTYTHIIKELDQEENKKITGIMDSIYK